MSPRASCQISLTEEHTRGAGGRRLMYDEVSNPKAIRSSPYHMSGRLCATAIRPHVAESWAPCVRTISAATNGRKTTCSRNEGSYLRRCGHIFARLKETAKLETEGLQHSKMVLMMGRPLTECRLD